VLLVRSEVRTFDGVSPINVSPEVAAALSEGRPVLALESTIFTHGLPSPRNVDVALGAEAKVRELGVTPATIAIVDGVPHVGLIAGQIEALAAGSTLHKASVRDLPVVAAKSLSAGTTVAATAFLAQRVGVQVFSTGGLGGVHRGASGTFDESADLPTLAHTPIVVVSAGVKSILDIPLTLERLETLGLSLVGYRTTRFPGFYLSDSGHPLEYRVDSPGEVATMFRAALDLGLPSAVLVANPVPVEQQLDPEVLGAALDAALAEADRSGVAGKELTPFLLDRIQLATGGASVDTNVAVYENNVRLGAEIAAALAAQ
jgi:pseudouridine-5'-phosphate glycosidase